MIKIFIALLLLSPMASAGLIEPSSKSKNSAQAPNIILASLRLPEIADDLVCYIDDDCRKGYQCIRNGSSPGYCSKK